MILKPNTLSLITMYQCTAACEHCCFSCSPKVVDRLPTERLVDFIFQANQFETIKVIVFTGGECFLLGKDLDKLIALAKSQGYLTRVVTNGYWAVSEKAASRRVGELKESGLDEINFSTGHYHKKYVPLKNIVNGITAAIDFGLHGAIMIEDVSGSNGVMEYLMSVEKIEKAVNSGGLQILVSPWMSFDGDKSVDSVPRSIHETSACQACHTVLSVIAITPGEDLYACCGLPLRKIPEMKLLNLKGVRNIRGAIEGLPDDFLKIWLSIEGPTEVLKFVSQYESKITIPEHSKHICETCLHLYGNDSVRRVLYAHSHPKRDEIISKYLKRINSVDFLK